MKRKMTARPQLARHLPQLQFFFFYAEVPSVAYWCCLGHMGTTGCLLAAGASNKSYLNEICTCLFKMRSAITKVELCWGQRREKVAESDNKAMDAAWKGNEDNFWLVLRASSCVCVQLGRCVRSAHGAAAVLRWRKFLRDLKVSVK